MSNTLKEIFTPITTSTLTSVAPIEPIIRPTLLEAIAKLKKFSEQPGINDVIAIFSFFEVTDDIEITELQKPRGVLQKIVDNLSNKNIVNDGIFLREAAYYALLALAEYKPSEDLDFYLESIPEGKRIGTSIGHFFNIEDLIRFHNRKTGKNDYNGEFYGKWLINPHTNLPFHPRDVQQLKAFAAAKSTLGRKIEFENLLEEKEKEAKIKEEIKSTYFHPRRIARTRALALGALSEIKERRIPNRPQPLHNREFSFFNGQEHKTLSSAPQFAQFAQVAQDPNRYQIEALGELKSKGLTLTHVEHDWFNSPEHRMTLIHLMTRSRAPLSADVAISILHGLNAVQAKGIRQGLLRTEVLGFNYYQIQALLDYKSKGLTAGQLYEQNWFNSEPHLSAFSKLIAPPLSMSVDAALAELNGLTALQARGIEKGLIREDVIGISNLWQIDTLLELKQYGLNGLHLRGQYWFNKSEYMWAAKYLMAQRQPPLDAKATIAELNGLTKVEAGGVARGLARSEVVGLNFWQISTLAKLKQSGLNADDLRHQDWFNTNDFDKAAVYLMTKKQPPLDAKATMTMLHGLNSGQALGIGNGLSITELTGLNFWQIQALAKLKSRGLTADHLRGQNWFNDCGYKEALSRLMTRQQSPLEIGTAMEILRGLTQEQIYSVAYGLSETTLSEENSAPSENSSFSSFSRP